ncbi:MAG: carboxymuconolactone decarboxylase family protein [Candidatus Binatia bacterium]|nr:carboxymuconolactone decarboxylase family protein [Candidatus Binatia bacterium]
MARLPYPKIEELPEDVRTTLAQLPVQLNVFRMLAHATSCFRPWLRLGTALLNELELAPRLRELVILTVARECGCAYEWAQHEALARIVGVPQEQVRAIERGELSPAAFSETELLVLAVTKALLAAPRIDDELWHRLVANFSPRQIVELCLVVGFYAMLARVLETTGVDLDTPFAEALEKTNPS